MDNANFLINSTVSAKRSPRPKDTEKGGQLRNADKKNNCGSRGLLTGKGTQETSVAMLRMTGGAPLSSSVT